MHVTQRARLYVTTHLGEARFNDDEKTVTVKVLQPGWSKNGNYYSKEVAASLADKLRESTKSFVDHRQDEQTRKFGRSLQDWAATVQATQVEQTVPYATMRMTENPATAWLYEEAKKHPHEVGISIDAQAKVTEHGEAEGRKGRIVEEILSARCDFVAAPSAGGHVTQVTQAQGHEGESTYAALVEGDLLEMEHGESEMTPMAMTMMDMRKAKADREKGEKADNELWDVWRVFKQVMGNIHDPKNPASDADKKAAFDQALADLQTEVSKIDWKAMAAMHSAVMASSGDSALDADLVWEGLWDLATVQEGDAFTVMDVELTEAKYTFSDASWADVDKSTLTADDHLIVGDPLKKGTWHLPYKQGSTIYKGALRAISAILKSGQFRGQEVTFEIPQAVRTKVKTLLKAAKIGEYAEGVDGTLTILTTKEDGIMTIEEVKVVITEMLAPMIATLNALTDGQKTVTESLQAQAQIVDRLDVADKATHQHEHVMTLVREANLPMTYVTETFQRQLLALSDDTAIKEAIEDRKGIVFRTAGRPVDSGMTRPVEMPAVYEATLPKDEVGRLALFN